MFFIHLRTSVWNPCRLHIFHGIRLLDLKWRWPYLAQTGHKLMISLLFRPSTGSEFETENTETRLHASWWIRNFGGWTSKRHIENGVKFVLIKLIIKNNLELIKVFFLYLDSKVKIDSFHGIENGSILSDTSRKECLQIVLFKQAGTRVGCSTLLFKAFK